MHDQGSGAPGNRGSCYYQPLKRPASLFPFCLGAPLPPDPFNKLASGLQGTAATLPWQYHGRALVETWHGHGAVPWQCHGSAIGLPWQCHRVATAVPWHCHGSAMAVLLQCHCLLWHCHGGAMQCHGTAVALPWHCHRPAYCHRHGGGVGARCIPAPPMHIGTAGVGGSKVHTGTAGVEGWGQHAYWRRWRGGGYWGMGGEGYMGITLRERKFLLLDCVIICRYWFQHGTNSVPRSYQLRTYLVLKLVSTS